MEPLPWASPRRRAAQTKKSGLCHDLNPGMVTAKLSNFVARVCLVVQETVWVGLNWLLACLDSVTSSFGLSPSLCWEPFCSHSHKTDLSLKDSSVISCRAGK